ncbi:MAG: iron transporter [Peptococcaceae bacterium BRH_c8a]|nr:MAG: iron transporter [Peptococcaceae bacterium BRH_c8a]
MTLDQVRTGDWVKIISIADERIREQAFRMGIDEGEEFTCAGVIPAGPVVLSKHRQEIAVGRELARHINVEMLAPVRQTKAGMAALEGGLY